MRSKAARSQQLAAQRVGAQDLLMSVRNRLMRLGAELRFRAAEARIEIGEHAQIRSFQFAPRKSGAFVLGERSIFAGRLAMDREGALVRIGPRSFIGRGLIAVAQSVEIGADVLLSWGVTVIDHHSHSLSFADRSKDVAGWLDGKKSWQGVAVEPVRIGDKVWVGFGVSILPGVTIGEGAVVGAASVVTRDVEAWTVVAGNPARVIRQLEPGQ